VATLADVPDDVEPGVPAVTRKVPVDGIPPPIPPYIPPMPMPIPIPAGKGGGGRSLMNTFRYSHSMTFEVNSGPSCWIIQEDVIMGCELGAMIDHK
jgi:hypothetical protein